MYGGAPDPRVGTYPHRVQRDLDIGPRGKSRNALAARVPANKRPAAGGGISTPCGAKSTRGMTVFVSGLL